MLQLRQRTMGEEEPDVCSWPKVQERHQMKLGSVETAARKERTS